MSRGWDADVECVIVSNVLCAGREMRRITKGAAVDDNGMWAGVLYGVYEYIGECGM